MLAGDFGSIYLIMRHDRERELRRAAASGIAVGVAWCHHKVRFSSNLSF